jgi:hypothetical protein
MVNVNKGFSLLFKLNNGWHIQRDTVTYEKDVWLSNKGSRVQCERQAWLRKEA